MLIREKKNFFTVAPAPLKNLLCIAGGADNAAVLTAERFQGCGRVDICDRRDELVRIDDFGEFLPAARYLLIIRHIGHRTAGSQIRQNHSLGITGQNIGSFSHEMHAAENDIRSAGLSGLLRQF